MSSESIHNFFGLSYANYLVLPRSVLQSMPDDWQEEFVRLLLDIHDKLGDDWEPEGGYHVRARDIDGNFMEDDYSNYERGRRKLGLRCPWHGSFIKK